MIFLPRYSIHLPAPFFASVVVGASFGEREKEGGKEKGGRGHVCAPPFFSPTIASMTG